MWRLNNFRLALLTIAGFLAIFDAFADIVERPVLVATVSRAYGVHPTSRGFRDGMEQLGYKEFVDYVVGDFYTRGDNSRLPSILDQIATNGSHIIITMNEQASIEAKKISQDIPVLFSGVSNPVGLGLVGSFARPSQGMTGIANIDHELDRERWKRFRQLIPKLNRVLYVYPPEAETSERINSLRESAKASDIELIEKPVSSVDDAQAYFARINRGEFDAILSPNNASLGLMGLATQASRRTGIPSLGHTSDLVEAGALASYGASYHAAGVQLARMVDKLIKGVDINTIPVEMNRAFELVVNLSTAREIGLDLPPAVLYQAERVIREH